MEQKISHDGLESKPAGFLTCGGGFGIKPKSRVPRALVLRTTNCLQDPSSDKNDLENSDKTSNTYISNDTFTPDHDRWKNLIGHRVRVSGVKQGILRYYGETKFAEGLWCGVELEDPVGKNDGSVKGVQYFNCELNHGIFAPFTKVELLENIPDNENTPLENKEVNNCNKIDVPTSLGLENKNTDSSKLRFEKSVKSKLLSPKIAFKDSVLKPNSNDCTPVNEIMTENVFSLNTNNIIDNLDDSSLVTTPTNAPPKLTEDDLGSLDLDKAFSFEELKRRKENMLLSDVLSSGLFDGREECDDDQLSLELDESLGILTPSQMNDFTVCADTQTSCGDLEAITIPSSESFDDINEIPEHEEVQGITISFINSDAMPVISSVTMSRTSSVPYDIQESGQKSSKSEMLEIKNKGNSVEELLLTVGSFNETADESYLDSTLLQSPQVSDIDQKESVSNHINVVQNLETNRLELCEPSKITNVQSVNLCEVPANNTCITPVSVNKVGNERNNETVEVITDSHCTNEILETAVGQEILKANIHTTEMETLQDKEDNKSVSSGISNINENEKTEFQKGNLTVTWEDVQEVIDLTKEDRPESLYTIGSTDTGYHEDGDFDTHSDIGILDTIHAEDSLKRFSCVSHDSCVVAEDNEVEKLPESASSSGYSTGVSESGNERLEDELNEVSDKISSKFSGLSCHQNSEEKHDIQLELEAVVEEEEEEVEDDTETDNNNMKTITNDTSQTVIKRDITVNDLSIEILSEETLTSETVIEAEISAEDSNIVDSVTNTEKDANKSNLSTSKQDVIIENSNDKKESVEVVEEKLDKISRKESASGLFSKNKNQKTGKIKDDSSKKVKKDNSIEKDKSEEASDNKKSVAKPPKKNVMSKIKAMIEATSCKSASKADIDEHAIKPLVLAPVPLKKSKWESVTSKIAASLAEEKTKPRSKKDVKSRVDTNLTVARQVTTKRSPKLETRSFSSSQSESGLVCVPPTSKNWKQNVDCHSDISGKNSLIAESTDSNQGSFCDMVSQHNRCSKTAGHFKTILSCMSGCATPVNKVLNMLGDFPVVPSTSKVCSPKKETASSRSTSPVAPSERSSVSMVSHSSHPPSNVITHQQSHRGSCASLASAASGALHVAKNKVMPCGPVKKAAPVKNASDTKANKGKSTSKEQNPAKPTKTTSALRTTSRPPASSYVSRTELNQEIQRLGSLCEARTKELNLLKMKLKHAAMGFDAFSVLVKYLTEELDALSHPQLLYKLRQMKEEHVMAEKQLRSYQEELQGLKQQHANEIAILSQKIKEAHRQEIIELHNRHSEELRKVHEQHEEEISKMIEKHLVICNDTEEGYIKTIEQIKEDFLIQKEEILQTHSKEFERAEQRHQEAQASLADHLDVLQKEYNSLHVQARQVEEALQKDTDTKIQWISLKKADLEKEVDSLKAVLEMKRGEIHALRKENMEMKKELEELPMAKEKIKMLQARAEDLQALVEEKVRVERQLSSDHQVLKESFEKEYRVNKRLSMEKEELVWRLKQNETNLNLKSISEPASYAEETEEEEKIEKAVSDYSPSKSPAKLPRDRPVFFTYATLDDVDSSGNDLPPRSPRTGSAYKKIFPPPPSSAHRTNNLEKSPNRMKSPSSPGSRKMKVHNSSEVLSPRGTPRRTKASIQKARISAHHRIKTDDNIAVDSDSPESSISESLDSTASNNLLLNSEGSSSREIGSHQMPKGKAHMQIKKNGQNLKDCHSNNYWGLNLPNENGISKSPRGCADIPSGEQDSSNASLLDETPDPKQYYQVAFPVLNHNNCNADPELADLEAVRNKEQTEMFCDSSNGHVYEEHPDLFHSDKKRLEGAEISNGDICGNDTECSSLPDSMVDSTGSISASLTTYSSTYPSCDTASYTSADGTLSESISTESQPQNVTPQPSDVSSYKNFLQGCEEYLYTCSPLSLAGEAMVHDSSLSISEISSNNSAPVANKLGEKELIQNDHKMRGIKDLICEKSSHICQTDPSSLETSSLGLHPTDSTTVDISLGEEELFSD